MNTNKQPLADLGIKGDWLPEGSRLRKERTPYIELLPEKQLAKSFNKSLDAIAMYRSASVDIGSLGRLVHMNASSMFISKCLGLKNTYHVGHVKIRQ